MKIIYFIDRTFILTELFTQLCLSLLKELLYIDILQCLQQIDLHYYSDYKLWLSWKIFCHLSRPLLSDAPITVIWFFLLCLYGRQCLDILRLMDFSIIHVFTVEIKIELWWLIISSGFVWTFWRSSFLKSSFKLFFWGHWC